MTCSLPLIYKVTVGRVGCWFLSNFKAGKMSNGNKESTSKSLILKKKRKEKRNVAVECNVLRTCMSSEKACDCGLTDTLSLWVGQQSWGNCPTKSETPFNINQFALIILILPRQWQSLASQQKLARLTKWCMKGSKTLWNSMGGWGWGGGEGRGKRKTTQK